MIGSAGFMAGPKPQKSDPDPDQFRAGDTWENSRGTLHRVIRVDRGIAHMINEKTGRTHSRAWDDTGWKSGRPWLRVSCG